MDFKRLFFLLVLAIAALNCLPAQKVEVVIDSIYNKYMGWEDRYLLIGKGQESMLLDGAEIKPYPETVERFKAGNLGVPLVQVGERCFLLNDELKFDKNKYVDLNLGSISGPYSYGNKLAYSSGGIVYVADFITHEIDYVLKGAGVFGINEGYIWMQSKSSEEDYIYNLKTKKASILPSEFQFPRTDHPYFIINAPLDENVHVLNLDLKDVVLPSEGYNEFYASGDVLIVFGRRKPAKVFYKDEPLALKEKYIDVECNYHSKVCFLTSSSGKVSVLNPDGEFVSKAGFDESLTNSFQDQNIVSIIKGNKLFTYTADFKYIFKGEYEEVQFVDDNRFLVKENGTYKIVDRDNAVVIPQLPLIPKYTNVYEEYGPKLLLAYNGIESVLYDYAGAEIVRWENKKEDKFDNPGKYFRGINLRMVASLDKDVEMKINPSGIWMRREQSSRGNIVFLCDKTGKRLTENFKRMILLGSPGLYLVQTLSRKIGVIRVER